MTYGPNKWEPWSGIPITTNGELCQIGLAITRAAQSEARTRNGESNEDLGWLVDNADDAHDAIYEIQNETELEDILAGFSKAWDYLINCPFIDNYGLELTQARMDAGDLP